MDIDEQDKQDIKNLDAVYKRLKRGVLKGINPNQKACIYNYKGKNFMLGSVCTNALDEIARIKGLFAITDMLEKRRIINIDRNDRERYKCCYGCRKYNVKQKPHRKDPRANYRCGNCIHKNMVQCYPCDRWVLHQSQDILKIDGKLVANPHFKFRMCNDCRINKRELDL